MHFPPECPANEGCRKSSDIGNGDETAQALEDIEFACQQKSRGQDFAEESEVSATLSKKSRPSLRSGRSPDVEATNSSKRRSKKMLGSFIKVDKKSNADHDQNAWNKLRRGLLAFVTGSYMANCVSMVVLLDAYLTCYDIDTRANGQPTPAIISQLLDICLSVYTLEIILLCTAHGCLNMRAILLDWVFLLDLLVICCGYVEASLRVMSSEVDLTNFGIIRALRVARIIRVTRLLRKSHDLRELRKLVNMMATCVRTLIWSFIFCFAMMTFWSMLIVEIVHPHVKQLSDLEACDQCRRATSSVMDANLLLFKTVIAGDSWGQIAVPVIEANPGTAVIFMGSLLTLVFGVLNLIVAVVVDTFAEARERDVLSLAEELENEIEIDKRLLQKIFERIDEDGSGDLTLQEIIAGARRDTEFQSRLRVMDIDEVDLEQLFEMIDADGSGSVEASEFIVPLSRWVHDSKTAPRFIKYNMLRTMHQQEELMHTCEARFALLTEKLDAIAHSLGGCNTPWVRSSDTKSGWDSTTLCPSGESRFLSFQHTESFEEKAAPAGILPLPSIAAAKRVLQTSLSDIAEHAEVTLQRSLRLLEALPEQMEISH
ncbi:TPC1 [Symbiodinium sp. CCMP2592]|nr:TPC1 [Symbiodinium sp. CCMP2592]